MSDEEDPAESESLTVVVVTTVSVVFRPPVEAYHLYSLGKGNLKLKLPGRFRSGKDSRSE